MTNEIAISKQFVSTARIEIGARVFLGGENIRYDTLGHLTKLDSKVDILVSAPLDASPAVIWQSPTHGLPLAVFTEEFDFLILIADPDTLAAGVDPVTVSLMATNPAGAKTLIRSHKFDRNTPFVMQSSRVGSTFAEIETAPQRITQLKVSATTNPTIVRLLLLAVIKET